MEKIQWKEQPGLYDMVVAAGHYVEHTQDGSFADNAEAVQRIIDGYDASAALAFAKAEKTRAILIYAKRLRDAVIAMISAGEMASWSIKKAEAAQFDANGSLPADALLSLEAEQRGISLSDLVVKVQSNAVEFERAEAAIGGTDGRHRDAVKALETVAEVIAYDISAGWPEA